MTDHTRAEDFSAYLDGMLRVRRAARLEQHVEGCERCRSELRALQMAKQAVAALPEVEPPAAWLPQGADSPFAAAAGGLRSRALPSRGRSSSGINRSRRALAGGLVMVGLAGAALGLGAWLVPPPSATVTFRQEVRQHLVLINDPLSDQTSYLLEARQP